MNKTFLPFEKARAPVFGDANGSHNMADGSLDKNREESANRNLWSNDMDEVIPPLAELEIFDFTKKFIDQQSVDKALRIIYQRRPDLFVKFADRERRNLGVTDILPDFYKVIRDEVSKEVDIPSQAVDCLISETLARVRKMYGLASPPSFGIAKDPLWKPSEEMVVQTIIELKNTPGNLWEELKAVEVNIGNLKNDIGNKFTTKLREMHPDLDGFKKSTLKMELRRRARREAGIVDTKPWAN